MYKIMLLLNCTYILMSTAMVDGIGIDSANLLLVLLMKVINFSKFFKLGQNGWWISAKQSMLVCVSGFFAFVWEIGVYL